MKQKTLSHLLLTLGTLSLMVGCGTDNKKNANDRPASSIGISHSITCYEDPTQKVIDILVANCYVHSVDGDSNPISGLTFDVSVITNVKEFSEATGTIQTTSPITFADIQTYFPDSDVKATDNLIILPTSETTDVAYLGNWEIVEVGSELTLAENASNLVTTEKLSYVIGNETVSDFGSSASVHIEYPESNIQPVQKVYFILTFIMTPHSEVKSFF
ncbi:MAG: hypothetical protein Q9M36_08540 [Sulfurovum sp.]|nr:hypothetical protein [Sulfurovum sp.]